MVASGRTESQSGRSRCHIRIRFPALVCSYSSANIRIVAFIAEAAPVQRILTHIGEPTQPPPIAPARGPPAWDDALAGAVPDWDALAQPELEYLFDQQVQW
jgi:hypothetical protein